MSPVWWITSSFEGLSIRLFGHCWMLRTLQLQGARCKIVLDAKCRKTFPWSPWSCVKSKRTSILMLETKHANDVLHIFEGWNEGMYSFLLSVHNRTTTCSFAILEPRYSPPLLSAWWQRWGFPCTGWNPGTWDLGSVHPKAMVTAAICSYTFFHQRCYILAKCWAVLVKCMWGVLLFVVHVQLELQCMTIQNKHT